MRAILRMAIAGMDIIPTLTFQMLPVMKPFLAHLGGRLAIQKSIHSCAEVFLSSTSSQVASCSNSNPPLPLSKARTINRGSQYSATSAIPTCSSIIFQKGTFLDSLTAEPVTGPTGFCRSRANWNTRVEGTTSTSSALPSDVRVSSRVMTLMGMWIVMCE